MLRCTVLLSTSTAEPAGVFCSSHFVADTRVSSDAIRAACVLEGGHRERNKDEQCQQRAS